MKRFGVAALFAVLFCLSLTRDAQATVDTHTIYLNNCEPGGCVVKNGATNATTDTSSTGHGTLSAFSQSATIWASVVSCVQTTFSAFDVTVTDTRPTSGDYFEVMIAGTDSDLGFPSDTGAVGQSTCTSPGACDPFIANALVFVFANDGLFANDANGMCAAAAEELAATWAIDHVVDTTDVMAFSIGSTTRSFHDGEACGGDCSGSTDPFGQTCTGSGVTATHTCIGTNKATQDEVQILLTLFGAAPAPTADGGLSDGGTTTDGGSTSDSGIATDGGVATDGGNATNNDDAGSESEAPGDSGGCNFAGSSRRSFPLEGFALVVAALALLRSKRSRARRNG